METFVADFAAAIAADDVAFLFERLHPLVLEVYEPDLCRRFIVGEILVLEDYRATAAPAGPSTRDQLGEEITNFYEIPVAFGFQGQNFDASAALAVVGGEVRWFAQCR